MPPSGRLRYDIVVSDVDYDHVRSPECQTPWPAKLADAAPEKVTGDSPVMDEMGMVMS
jgi:hypothetical protein